MDFQLITLRSHSQNPPSVVWTQLMNNSPDEQDITRNEINENLPVTPHMDPNDSDLEPEREKESELVEVI